MSTSSRFQLGSLSGSWGTHIWFVAGPPISPPKPFVLEKERNYIVFTLLSMRENAAQRQLRTKVVCPAFGGPGSGGIIGCSESALSAQQQSVLFGVVPWSSSYLKLQESPASYVPSFPTNAQSVNSSEPQRICLPETTPWPRSSSRPQLILTSSSKARNSGSR